MGIAALTETAAIARLALMRPLLLLGLALVLSTPVRAEPAAPPSAPAQDQPSDSAKDLDKLYARLARTRFPDEATGIVGEIAHLRMESGSDTAGLLLDRALKARAAANLPLAMQLCDALVDVDPEWSEAWSQRATLRFQSGDLAGAMGDIAQTLKREPRDIGALAGLAALMLDHGDAEAALTVYDRALKLAPAYEPLVEARARAQTEHLRRSP